MTDALDWIKSLSLLLLPLCCGCDSFVCDFVPPQAAEIEVKARYSPRWMVRHYLCPYTIDEIRKAEEQYPGLLPAPAKGLRTLVYRPESEPLMFNLEPSGGEISLSPGRYGLLFVNNGTQNISFSGMDKPDTATASVYAGDSLAPGPDMLYAAVKRDVKLGYQLQNQIIEVELEPRVYTYLIMVDVDSGMEDAAGATFILSGQASEVKLASGEVSGPEVMLKSQSSMKKNGIVGILKTFGTMASRIKLIVRVLFKNGIVADYPADVSRELTYQPLGGIVKVKIGKISPFDGRPPENPEGEGFNVGVNGWEGNTDLPVVWR